MYCIVYIIVLTLKQKKVQLQTLVLTTDVEIARAGDTDKDTVLSEITTISRTLTDIFHICVETD